MAEASIETGQSKCVKDEFDREQMMYAMVERQASQVDDDGVCDERMRTWVRRLNTMWLVEKQRNSEIAHYVHENVLNNCFLQARPDGSSQDGSMLCGYAVTLTLMKGAFDFFQGKQQGMAARIYHAFIDWLRRHPQERRKPSDDTQFSAFYVLTKQTALIDSMIKTYHLDTIRDTLIANIMKLVEGEQYSTAAKCAIGLGVLDKFNVVHFFVIPSFLQGSNDTVHLVLNANKEAQIQWIRTLDDLVGGQNYDANLARFVDQHKHRVRNIRLNKDLYPRKTMEKTIRSLLKQYGHSEDLSPNFVRSRGMGTLGYVLRERYPRDGRDEAKRMKKSTFVGMVTETLDARPELRFQPALMSVEPRHGYSSMSMKKIGWKRNVPITLPTVAKAVAKYLQ